MRSSRDPLKLRAGIALPVGVGWHDQWFLHRPFCLPAIIVTLAMMEFAAWPAVQWWETLPIYKLQRLVAENIDVGFDPHPDAGSVLGNV